MKFLQYTILTITLSLVILLPTIQFTAFNYPWYEKEFVKLGIYQRFSAERVSNQTNNLFKYFQSKEKLVDSYYTTKEKLHLQDIKTFLIEVKIINSLLIIILAVELWLIYKKQGIIKLIKSIFYAGLISLTIYLLITVLLIFDFDQLFLIFHQLSFPNDYWQLDPNIESLIVIFPPELFAELAKKIIIMSLIIVSLLSLLSGVFLFIKSKSVKSPGLII